MKLSAVDFRQIAARFATGVTVVTFIRGDGEPGGLTVNAFTSLSLEPLQVLIAIDKGAESHEELREGSAFCVNILSSDQIEVARRFAGPRDHGERFRGLPRRQAANGAPVLRGVLAYLGCRVARHVDGGDHTIFIGRVEEGESFSSLRPLVFYEGRYGSWIESFSDDSGSSGSDR